MRCLFIAKRKQTWPLHWYYHKWIQCHTRWTKVYVMKRTDIDWLIYVVFCICSFFAGLSIDASRSYLMCLFLNDYVQTKWYKIVCFSYAYIKMAQQFTSWCFVVESITKTALLSVIVLQKQGSFSETQLTP